MQDKFDSLFYSMLVLGGVGIVLLVIAGVVTLKSLGIM